MFLQTAKYCFKSVKVIHSAKDTLCDGYMIWEESLVSAGQPSKRLQGPVVRKPINLIQV